MKPIEIYIKWWDFWNNTEHCNLFEDQIIKDQIGKKDIVTSSLNQIGLDSGYLKGSEASDTSGISHYNDAFSVNDSVDQENQSKVVQILKN